MRLDEDTGSLYWSERDQCIKANWSEQVNESIQLKLGVFFYGYRRTGLGFELKYFPVADFKGRHFKLMIFLGKEFIILDNWKG